MHSRGANDAADSMTETDNLEGRLIMTRSHATEAGESVDSIADTDTTEHTTLTSLPPELVHRVCDHIEDDDNILSLLLAYKDGSLPVDDYFLDHHMSHRRHVLTKYSLETLVKITECPQLTRRMRSITIAVAETISEYRWLRSHHRRYTEPLTEKHKAVWTKWCAECDSLADGEGAKLLAAALSNLKHAGIIPALALDYPREGLTSSEALSDRSKTFGFRQLEETLDIPRSERNLHETFRPDIREYPKSGSLLLQGIAQAKYPIKALTIGEGWFIHLSTKTFATNLDKFVDLRFCLSSLTKLDWTMNKIEYDCETTKASLLSLENAMRLATGLKTLILRFHGEKRYEEELGGFEAPFSDVFKHNQLKSLTIESSMINPKDLYYFLRQHRTTLEELEFSDINFTAFPDCEWPDALRKIAQILPALTHCRIDSSAITADEVLGAEIMDKYGHRKIWDFKGLGVVQEKLKHMAKSVRWD